ncbi:hypothetical protein NitYY0826_C0393 [Nitratiruptor sp. YY08-26]|uniref:PD-(D/E)XK nuclease family protein n=1 Tax=unclassified Nitratiruptor TaxID=2624044 RepID=UPI00191596B4|nr:MULTISPECIES: PD-(D/E)XK nuclease family protein [unclassified Nitratiruptor]BCD61538.1 hypothetical protein NitYY0813_C0392 [Nitratiruptor sp. YY08-13]BCD65472.1 hypothetical protein NitYY0826_C0393 [Nitratiruptor sp. YY08-26]
MKLLVFTTQRELRQYAAKHPQRLLPKLLTIGDFLDRAILSEYVFVQEELRSYYFYQACKDVELEKLGIEKSFEKFLHEGDLLYAFLKEMFLERVDFDSLQSSDTYAEYSEHLEILQEIRSNYKNILHSQGLTDIIVLDEYRINNDYFNEFEEIEIHLSGYLTRFDREVLAKITTPWRIEFLVSPFNLPLAKKMFAIQKPGRYTITKESVIHSSKELPKLAKIEYSAFSERIEQCNYVFAKIEEFVRSGIKPENIVVILPQADFKEFLESFDRLKNLNFSMGESFIYSPLYRKLEALYRYIYLYEEEYGAKLTDEDIEEFKKISSWSELQSYLFAKASDKEKRIIEEDLFRFDRFMQKIDISLEFVVKLLLQRLQTLSFDDIRGGKVTVMEVLESRGTQFDGVIIVDFNEEFVPQISQEDLFLNTATRKHAKLPTTAEKKSLQKHYYYRLLMGAKRAAVSFVKSDVSDASRFLWELPFIKEEEPPLRFAHVLYRQTRQPSVFEIVEDFAPPTKLSPTMLEILLKCPLRYYLHYHKNIKAPQVGYRGISIHSAIEEAIKRSPKNAEEYFAFIWQELVRGVSQYERYRLTTEWYKPLQKFAQEDFIHLQGEVETEVQKSRVLEGVELFARADRVVKKDDGVYIFDYKTNKTSNYLNDYNKDAAKLQAEFYAYIWQTERVYFWDLRNTKLQRFDTAHSEEKLKNALEKICTQTVKSQERDVCRYCPYKFGCKGEV